MCVATLSRVVVISFLSEVGIARGLDSELTYSSGFLFFVICSCVLLGGDMLVHWGAESGDCMKKLFIVGC